MTLSLTISRRFTLLAFLSGIIAVGAVAFSLTRARDAMIAQKRSEIRFLVEAAVTVIEGQRSTRAASEAPEQVKSRLAEMLRSSRFDGGNYIYIFDTKGQMVMHPMLPKLEGQSALGVVAPQRPDTSSVVERSAMNSRGERYPSALCG